jgi:hypothetical protein
MNVIYRSYFYEINVHGHLFLQETKHKNFTSCFKNIKFLDFFYSRIQPNHLPDHKEFQYISPCGVEMNFIKSEDAPMVFHSLKDDVLTFGGSLTRPFDPSQIRVSKSSGRIYHSLDTKAVFKGLGVGLVQSSVVLDQLYQGLDEESNSFTWKGKSYQLQWIP